MSSDLSNNGDGIESKGLSLGMDNCLWLQLILFVRQASARKLSVAKRTVAQVSVLIWNK